MFKKEARKPSTTWDKSEAKPLLHSDIMDGTIRIEDEPKKAWLSRPEYQDYHLVKFHQHLYLGRDANPIAGE